MTRTPGRVLLVGAAALAALAGMASLVLDRRSGARILWWQGRAASWAGDRGVVLDPDGGLLALAAGDRVEPLLLRAGGRSLLAAAAGEGGAVWLVDGAGTLLRRDEDGTVREVGRTPFDIPAIAPARGGGLWVARSAIQFTFRPESAGAAAVRLDERLQPAATAGAATIPANPFLAQLANAGHVLAMADGGAVFAPFIRDEVARYDSTGGLVWRLSRGLVHATADPKLIVVRGAGGTDVQVDYAPVNLGLAAGPDDMLYVLSTPRATTAESRLDAVDPVRGGVVRTWRFATALPTLAIDGRGRLTQPDPDALRPGTSRRRPPFPPFDLPDLRAGRVRSADVAGKVTLVNFWASWCRPCREEMPALDSLWRSYDPARVALVALSDDLSLADARAFIAELGFDFPVGFGRGGLKARYHYVGLPHTVLLDAENRLIRQWSGYGGPAQLRTIGALIDAELSAARPRSPHH